MKDVVWAIVNAEAEYHRIARNGTPDLPLHMVLDSVRTSAEEKPFKSFDELVEYVAFLLDS